MRAKSALILGYGSIILACMALGFLLGSWYGCAVGAILSALLVEFLNRDHGSRTLRTFFISPEKAELADAGSESLLYFASLAGLACSLEPSSFNGLGQRARQGTREFLSRSTRMVALESLLPAPTTATKNEERNSRSSIEAALKYADPMKTEEYLRACLKVDPDGVMPARLSLALAVMSGLNERGCLERVEAFLQRNGCSRSVVSRVAKDIIKDRVSAWDIMGIPPGSDRDCLKKTFHSLSFAFHPDLSASLGEEKRDQADQAYLKIREAYELLDSIIP
jgi:hypothetical protein